jgi:hypothetical protein
MVLPSVTKYVYYLNVLLASFSGGQVIDVIKTGDGPQPSSCVRVSLGLKERFEGR